MKKPFIIGITGSYGKTSCAYLVHEYFKSLDYDSSLMSSNKLCVGDIFLNTWSNEIRTPQELEYYLYKAQGSDFLIIEINENSLANGIYSQVNFDCKILVNFENGFNLHRPQNNYLNLKKDFMTDTSTITVVNKNSDCFEEFITPNTILFSTKENDKSLIYSKDKKVGLKQSNYKFVIDEKQYSLSGAWNITNYKNILTVIALLYSIDMLEIDYFLEEFLINCSALEGRGEAYNMHNRQVIIDRGNAKALKSFLTESEDSYQHNILSLLTAVGNIDIGDYNTLVDSGFVTLNKYNESNKEMRKHCLIFGGNLYMAYHKLKEFPLSHDSFTLALQELGYNPFLNFQEYSCDIDPYLVDELCRVTSMLGANEYEKSEAFYSTYWWRSIAAIKHCLTVHYDKFLKLFEDFMSLNNPDLTAACYYLKIVADYQRERYSQLANSVNDLPVKKFYLTLNNNVNPSEDQLTLESYKIFFDKDVEIFVSRKEALQHIVQDSQDNDVLFIAGRGDVKNYINNQTVEYFTDKEIINKIFQEGNAYEN